MRGGGPALTQSAVYQRRRAAPAIKSPRQYRQVAGGQMISGGSETVFHIGPWIGYGLALLGALALVWASFEFASADSRFNIVLLVGGGLIGWVMGVLLTPGLANQTSFSPYGTAILAFVGGYVVGKFDRIFDLSFRQPGDIDAGVIGRLVLFVGGVALGLLFSLMWRSGLGLF